MSVAIGSVVECTVIDSAGDGIQANSETLLRDNQCWGNGLWGSSPGAGIHLIGTRCRVEGNNLSENREGLLIATTATQNIILRNTAAANTVANYSIQNTNNSMAITVNVANNMSFQVDPLANLEY